MRAGSLRNRVVIESKTETTSESGEQTDTWGTFATVHARINPLKAGETYEAAQNVARVTHEITIRYLENVTHTMRVLWNSRYFYIGGIRNPDERNIQLILECYEEQG